MVELRKKFLKHWLINHINGEDRLMIFFLLKHEEEKLKNFVETLNEILPTIKFTTEWLQKYINFFRCHRFSNRWSNWNRSLCQIYWQSSINTLIPLRVILNWICSKNDFFGAHCNNLEKWLTEMGAVRR